MTKDDDEFLFETREGGQLEEYYHSCKYFLDFEQSYLNSPRYDLDFRVLGTRSRREGRSRRFTKLHQEYHKEGRLFLVSNFTFREG